MSYPTDPSLEQESVLREKISEFRAIAAEHKRLNPGNNISFDPGSDPIAKEAVIRLVEENIDEILAKHGAVLNSEELKRLKREFREQVERSEMPDNPKSL